MKDPRLEEFTKAAMAGILAGVAQVQSSHNQQVGSLQVAFASEGATDIATAAVVVARATLKELDRS